MTSKWRQKCSLVAGYWTVNRENWKLNLLNSALVGYEEFCISWGVLSISALRSENSSYPTQPDSIIAKYFFCLQFIIYLYWSDIKNTKEGTGKKEQKEHMIMAIEMHPFDAFYFRLNNLWLESLLMSVQVLLRSLPWKQFFVFTGSTWTVVTIVEAANYCGASTLKSGLIKSPCANVNVTRSHSSSGSGSTWPKSVGSSK